MKHLTLVVAVVAAFLFTGADWTPLKWGSVTNGARLGMETHTRDSFGRACPPLCVLYAQNVSSNFSYLVFPRPDRRYVAELRGPDGKQIGLKTAKQLSEHDKVVRRGLKPNEVSQIDHFSIADIFVLPTNGNYQFVIAAAACTNLLLRADTAYFLLPPVTNTFHVGQGTNMNTRRQQKH